MTELKNVMLSLKTSLSLRKGEMREGSGISVKSANSSQPFSCKEKGLLAKDFNLSF
jgi:hypothetical protein